MYTCGIRINAKLVKEGSFRINAKLVKEEFNNRRKDLMARNIEMMVNFHTPKNFPQSWRTIFRTITCLKIRECHRVNILSWNIRGITYKLQNKQLCGYICQHDIVCLVESMLDSQKTIHFSSYTVYNFARQVRP